jgi:hypothetical protein
MEGLDEKIIGSRVQTANTLLAPGRDHQYRDVRHVAAQHLQHLATVPPRQAEVEYHQIRLFPRGQGESTVPIPGQLHVMTVFDKGFL